MWRPAVVAFALLALVAVLGSTAGRDAFMRIGGARRSGGLRCASIGWRARQLPGRVAATGRVARCPPNSGQRLCALHCRCLTLRTRSSSERSSLPAGLGVEPNASSMQPAPTYDVSGPPLPPALLHGFAAATATTSSRHPLVKAMREWRRVRGCPLLLLPIRLLHYPLAGTVLVLHPSAPQRACCLHQTDNFAVSTMAQGIPTLMLTDVKDEDLKVEAAEGAGWNEVRGQLGSTKSSAATASAGAVGALQWACGDAQCSAPTPAGVGVDARPQELQHRQGGRRARGTCAGAGAPSPG